MEVKKMEVKKMEEKENRCKYCGTILPFNQFCCKSCFDSFESDEAYDDYDEAYDDYDEAYDDWEE